MADDQREGARAKAWRRAHGLSRRRLAELTGYGESTINAIEAGAWSGGRPIDPATMQTYRLACAAVALGVAFDWRDVALRPLRAEIRVPLETTQPASPAPPPDEA